ncbi:MAG: hypothetical protein IJ733_08295, partial [Lachnospiraceae bacterium]|nr:hypothetical protein [Lachnospiraceae bacterium]
DEENIAEYFRCFGCIYRSAGVAEGEFQWKAAMTYCISKYKDQSAIFEYLKEDLGDEFDCRKYVRHTFGREMNGKLGNFCETCPIGKPGAERDLVREYSLLARLACMDSKERDRLLDGVEQPLFSCLVNLNNNSFYGSSRLDMPCVVPVPQIICEILAETDYDDFFSEYPAEKLTEEVLNRIQIMAGRDIPVFREPAGREIMQNYLGKALYSASPCSGEELEAFVRMHCDAPMGEPEVIDFAEELKEIRGGSTDYPDRQETLAAEDPPASEGKEGFSAEVPTENGIVQGVDGEKDSADPDPRRKGVKRPAPDGAEPRLEDYPYFNAQVKMTNGAVFTAADHIESFPLSKRRYIVPFAANEDGNVIVHHEIPAALLDKMIDVSAGTGQAESELSALEAKVRKDSCAAVEVVWVPEQERYILLLWNAANRRYDYVPLIGKKDGQLHTVPYEIRQFLCSDKRKIICYQPYLLCGISGLYYRYLETKNVHSIYTINRVLMREAGCLMEDVFSSFFYGASKKILDEKKRYEDWYGRDNVLLSHMPFYDYIMKQQYSYAGAVGKSGLCASQYHKDLMYGYSYLAAGVYPSRQGAMFRLGPDDHIEFFKPMEPCISYIPSYIMEFTFMNVDEDIDVRAEDNIRNNQKARRLLLKEMAKMPAPWYHTGLKLLYMDDYRVVFFVSHRYRSVHKTDVSRILMHETYRYKIPSNRLYAKFWGTGMNVVRYINRH